MRRLLHSSGNRWPWRVAAVVVLFCAAFSLGACKAKNEAITEVSSAPVETGTVQATLPVDPNSIAVPDVGVSDSPASDVASAGPTASGKPSKIWPAKVGKFAAAFAGTVWYPKSIPAGYKIESLDIVELESGTGLVCDIIYTKAGKVIQFTQGSPKTRDYEVISAGRVDWGSEIAYLVHEDPADTTTPVILVYNAGGNFAELSGDISEATLRDIAKSMVIVK